MSNDMIPLHLSYDDIYRIAEKVFIVKVHNRYFLVGGMDVSIALSKPSDFAVELHNVTPPNFCWSIEITLPNKLHIHYHRTGEKLNFEISPSMVNDQSVLLRTTLEKDMFPAQIETIQALESLDRLLPYDLAFMAIFNEVVLGKQPGFIRTGTYPVPMQQTPTKQTINQPAVHEMRFNVSGTVCQAFEILDPDKWTPEAIVLGLQEGRLITTTAWDTAGTFLPAITDLDINVVAKIHLSEPDHNAGVEYTDFEIVEGWK